MSHVHDCAAITADGKRVNPGDTVHFFDLVRGGWIVSSVVFQGGENCPDVSRGYSSKAAAEKAAEIVRLQAIIADQRSTLEAIEDYWQFRDFPDHLRECAKESIERAKGQKPE